MLTLVVCKIMELILVCHTMQHLDTNNILLDTQCGSRSKYSCELQLFFTSSDLVARASEDALIRLWLTNTFEMTPKPAEMVLTQGRRRWYNK